MGIVLRLYDTSVYVSLAGSLFIGGVTYHSFLLASRREKSFQFLAIWVVLILAFESISYDLLKRELKMEYVGYGTIAGPSNVPTFMPGDVVLDDIRARNQLRRGDLLVIKGDWRFDNVRISKRLAAFEKETIEIKGGGVYVNDRKLIDVPFSKVDYVVDSTCQYARTGEPYTVPQGSLFVLGDNSSKSLDSRQVGPIKVQSVTGVNYKIVWPLSRAGTPRAQ